ncbi:mechanosensitive ion channel domain-containing protein [Agrobacterium sp.]|uniref:mechanosensitive ion channel domain-containing protein n=1 Tax=Agrobacterium sp. TaxID=361 RepID=UPI0028B18759|nr:mechanosensitive ion channel domain-containing protein [Agrobacterium sp.]
MPLRYIAAIFVLFLSLTLPVAPSAAQDSGATASKPASSVDDLIRILENEEARNALLSRLKSEVAAQAQTKAPPNASEPTIARQIAEQTKATAEHIVAGGEAVWEGVVGIATVLSEPDSVNYQALKAFLFNFFLVGAALFASFLLLRLISHFLQHRFANRAAGRHWSLRVLLMASSTLADVMTVALAWGAGYIIALQVVGRGVGRMDINQTLLLNAFLMVELLKVGMRMVLQPRFPALRLPPVCDTTAAYWYFWLARVISLVGYTFLFVAPVVASLSSDTAAQVVRVVVMLTVLLIALLVILQNRDRVRQALSARAASGRTDFLGRSGVFLAGIWHMLAIVYVVSAFVVWLVNPAIALPFMVSATLKSIIAFIFGGLVITFVGRFANAGLRLPDDVRLRLPMLEGRLQAFVPLMMQIVRTLVSTGVVIAVAQAWGLIDFIGWLASDTGQRITTSTIAALIILLLGFLAYLAMSSWVEYRLNPEFGSIPTSREKTLLSLFRNAFSIALVILVAMLALAQIGVNIAPLLAGAGVLGLAIGFGAQKLVQDIITGVFIQLENVMNEGDIVSLGNVTGAVEKLTIRSVSIRSLDGTLHLIPFSSVDTVSNLMKDFGYHVAEIRVGLREDIDAVKNAMQEAFELLMQTEWKDKVIDDLEMHGITAFGDSFITVRARIKTIAGSHWGTGRAYNEMIKQVFDRRDIKIPFPHLAIAGDITRKQMSLPDASGT